MTSSLRLFHTFAALADCDVKDGGPFEYQLEVLALHSRTTNIRIFAQFTSTYIGNCLGKASFGVLFAPVLWVLKRSVLFCVIARVQEVSLDFLTLEDGTDRVSRNVDTELPLSAA